MQIQAAVQDVTPRLRRAKPLRSRAKLHLATSMILEAEVDQVALNGISLFVPDKVREAEPCVVHLSLFVDGSARRVRANGTVVSCSLSGMNGFRVALRFTDIDQESATALDKLLR